MIGIAERTRFSCTAGSVVFWIEIKNNCMPFEVCQMYLTVFDYIIIANSEKRKIRSRLLLLYCCIAHQNLLQIYYESIYLIFLRNKEGKQVLLPLNPLSKRETQHS